MAKNKKKSQSDTQVWLIDQQGMDEFIQLMENKKDHVPKLNQLDPEGIRGGSDSAQANVINVHGPLLPRSNVMTNYFGIANYEDIGNQLSEYEARLEAGSTVYLDIDSGGGQGTGLFALGDRINASELNVVAYVSGRAASAAYVLAGACDDIYCQQAAEVGGLGVITGYLPAEQRPVNLVLSRFAKDKIPDRDLTQQSADKLEAFMYQKLESWDEGGDINPSLNIEKTSEMYGQGRMFMAEEAKEKGMVSDSVLLPPYLNTNTKTKGNEPLKNISNEDLLSQLAEQKTKLDADWQAKLDAQAGSAESIHARYKAVLSTDAAKANVEEALTFAADTRFTVEEAETFLSKLTPAEAKAPEGSEPEGDALSAAMKSEGSADLSTLEQDEEASRTAKLKEQEQENNKQPPKSKYGSESIDNYKLAVGEFEGGLEAYEAIYGELK